MISLHKQICGGHRKRVIDIHSIAPLLIFNLVGRQLYVVYLFIFLKQNKNKKVYTGNKKNNIINSFGYWNDKGVKKISHKDLFV